MDDRVSIRRFRSVVADGTAALPAEAVVQLLAELGPEGGDFVVLRATPDRAEAIERGLLLQLFTYGAHVAGPPVGEQDERLADGTYGGARAGTAEYAADPLLEAAQRVLEDHAITDLEDGGRVYVDALALADLRDQLRGRS